MSETKRTFLKATMNTDVDERVIPDGNTAYSLNNQIAKSEGSDVGALENSLGNESMTSLGLTNSKSIGYFKDHRTHTIYYFITSDEKDLLVEYNDLNQSTNIILESTRIDGETLLGFKKDKLITGVVKVIGSSNSGDLFGWTDNNKHPRLINLQRAKTYEPDGFTEDHISLIKRPPIFPPKTTLTFSDSAENAIKDRFFSFAYAWRYKDGQTSALSPLTNPAFASGKFSLDPNTLENEGMVNAFSAVDIELDTGGNQVTDVMLVFKESNSTSVYVVDVFNKEAKDWSSNETRSFKFDDIKIYNLLDDSELYRLYDNVPRRAKAMDTAGNRIAFANYVEGYDLVDIFSQKLKIDFNLSLFTRDLSGDSISTTVANGTNTDDIITLYMASVDLKKGTRLTIGLDLKEPDGRASFSGSFDYILRKDYPYPSQLAADEDFISFVETSMTNKFMRSYEASKPADSQLEKSTPFIIFSSSIVGISIEAPTLSYEIDNTPDNPDDEDYTTDLFYFQYTKGEGSNNQVRYKDVATDSSCKTNRSYEVAPIYIDEYGRSTTPITSQRNFITIPQSNSVKQSKIRVNINHNPPYWAKYYRFAIKQNKTSYQTIYGSQFYEDKEFRWIKLNGANKDKVEEGDTLIVKSDLNGALKELITTRVLKIESKQPDFIKDNVDKNNIEIIEDAGLYMKIKPSAFDLDYAGDTFKEYNEYDRDDDRAYIWLGSFTKKDSDGIEQPIPINAGTTIYFWIKSYGRDPEKLYEKKFVAADDYTDFQQFFETEVEDLEGKVNKFEFRTEGGGLYLGVESYQHGTWVNPTKIRGKIRIRYSEGYAVFETKPKDEMSDIYNEQGQTFEIKDGFHSGNIQSQNKEDSAIVEMDFFNCFAQGDGVESYRYKDDFNSNYLSIDTRPTTDADKEFKEIHRYADITYSEPFVESLGINGLSTFNLAKANYKDDIAKNFGSIQKIASRDRDLLVMQEDKISKVLYGKELIVSPDGNSNISGVDKVLGSQVMYAGEHGVSLNPESVAFDGNRVYFTDEKRNDVCRLSINGVSVISNVGMTKYFRDFFANNKNKAKIGAFDPYNEKYVLSAGDQIIHTQQEEVDCGSSIVRSNFKGQMIAEIDFGLDTGSAGVTILSENGENLRVALEYNGQTIVNETSGIDEIVFNKENVTPREARLIISSETSTDFSITGDCISRDALTVVNFVKGDASYSGDTVISRYKWIKADYVSSFEYLPETFNGANPIRIVKKTGREGDNDIPKNGSEVVMEAYKSFDNTVSFDSNNNNLMYLVTDTVYNEFNSDDMLLQANDIETFLQDASENEKLARGKFVFDRPNKEKFLYLIWDYSS